MFPPGCSADSPCDFGQVPHLSDSHLTSVVMPPRTDVRGTVGGTCARMVLSR